jgi:hypothetical protein
MSMNFQIKMKRRNGDLYISPRGDFDGNAARKLVNLLDEQYDGKGQVFIETRNLRKIHPYGCITFRSCLGHITLPARRLSFTGAKGYEIAPEECGVFMTPQE